jgi:hypothetical protein
MCRIISWIEVEGKNLYMDNESLRDSYARELIKETGHNEDVEGHGFIRKYYNIPEGKGKEFEVNDFWNYGKLPEEIANKFRNNEMDELFKYVSNYGLINIVRYATDTYKEKAWKLLLKNNPSNFDLSYIVCYATDTYKEKAWKLLLKNNPSHDELRYIVCCATDTYKEKAWKLILKNNPSNNDLRGIVCCATDTYKEKAWKLILKNNPSNDDLRDIVYCTTDTYKEKARLELAKRNQ